MSRSFTVYSAKSSKKRRDRCQSGPLVLQRDYWKNARRSLVSCALRCRCFFLLRPLIFGRFPSLIWIVAIHLFKGLQRLRSEVLLIDDAVRTDNESFYSRNSMLSRRCRQGEPADHGAFHDEVHLAHWGSRLLSLQHFEIVAMKWLSFFRLALLERCPDSLSDRTRSCAIRFGPRQTVLLATIRGVSS